MPETMIEMPMLASPLWHDPDWMSKLHQRFECSDRRRVTLTRSTPEITLDQDARVVGNPALVVAGVPCFRDAAIYAGKGSTIRLRDCDVAFFPHDVESFTAEYDVAVSEGDRADLIGFMGGLVKDIAPIYAARFTRVDRRTVTLTLEEPRHVFTATCRVVCQSGLIIAGIPCGDRPVAYAQVGQAVCLTDPRTGPVIVEYDVPVDREGMTGID